MQCRRDLLYRSYFNPRPPYGGRRFRADVIPFPNPISIHVLRMEDDVQHRPGHATQQDFNPRPPYGGRRNYGVSPPETWLFQSTSSVWRTTRLRSSLRPADRNFNPRPPCGGRPTSWPACGHGIDFNPRPPCGGRLKALTGAFGPCDFNPRPPCGGRLL